MKISPILKFISLIWPILFIYSNLAGKVTVTISCAHGVIQVLGWCDAGLGWYDAGPRMV